MVAYGAAPLVLRVHEGVVDVTLSPDGRWLATVDGCQHASRRRECSANLRRDLQP
jgi:hypothetical protein